MAIRFNHATRTAALATACMVALASSVAAAGCDRRTGYDAAGLPNGKVTRDFTCAQPDASLVYPGATKLSSIRSKEDSNELTYCGQVMSTPDDQALVYDWYRSQLEQRNYYYTGAGNAGPNLINFQYQKQGTCREAAKIAVDSPRALRNHGVLTTFPADARTIFEYTYFVSQSDQAWCRQPKPTETAPPTTFPLTKTTDN